MAAPRTLCIGRRVLRETSSLSRTLAKICIAQNGSDVCHRCASTTTGHAGAPKAEKINQAMKAYLERAKAHDTFMKHEEYEFEMGKRHLAHIMGADPDNFSQEEIDAAIEYLLPSGIFAKKARPMLRPPSEVIPKRKAAQFGMDGRPFHSLFYTGTAHYFQLMHDLAQKFNQLKQIEDEYNRKGIEPDPAKKLVLAGSVWIDKPTLEHELTETLSDDAYEAFVKMLVRISGLPFAYEEKDLIMGYRKVLSPMAVIQEVSEVQFDADGRPYQDASGRRKTARASVRLWDHGTGQVNINGRDLLRQFPEILDREQVLFPLQFTGKLGTVDIEARVESGGHSSQAGALRLALATALQSLVDRDMIDKMRMAGLLTQDPRRRERKKFGQEGARRKYTWKKR